MYALHAASVAVGFVTTLMGLRDVYFGIPSLVAVGMNLLRRTQVRGTWLQSHFEFQLRTFGWAAFWFVMATLGLGTFVVLLTSLPLLQAGFIAIFAWAAWRALLGWQALRGRRAAPPGSQEKTT